MPPTVIEVFEFALLALTSIFFLVDPFAVIPLFLAVTSDASAAEHKRVALRSAFTCAIVLCVFALAGSLIFKLFGITLPAFKIAGGIILLQIGVDMLQAKQSGQRSTPEETEEGTAKEDASIIPLGMPMLAGRYLDGDGADRRIAHGVASRRGVCRDTHHVACGVFGPGRRGARAALHGRNRHSHIDAADGPAARRARCAVHRQRSDRFWPAEKSHYTIISHADRVTGQVNS